ncbi:TPA: hypothetical protein TZC30_001255 [Streptococcus suis]|nr:hypothetical protein [Streptococcus suis]HEM5086081.1 hypothetical protein [Streptococcus suis]HEP1830309.1 hypothetical protein [Streptococcus suis]
MKIKSSLGNEVEDRTGVRQSKLTTDNFDIRRVLNNAAKKSPTVDPSSVYNLGA